MTDTNIMIVEDEIITAQDIKMTLEKKGYRISCLATSGEEAIERAEQDHPDLVLMDIMLNGEIDGIAAAHEIHTHLDIPVIYLTSHYEDGMVLRARNTEPYGYLLKPFNEIELYTNIEMALFKAQAKKRLLEQENKFRFLAHTSSSCETWRSPDGRYAYVSPSCEAITGYRPEEFIADARLVEKIAHQDDRDMISRCMHRALQGTSEAGRDFRIITRSGDERWIQYVCQPAYDDKGSFIGIRENNHDITQRKQAEQALEEREEKYRLLFSRECDAIMLFDRTTRRLLEANDASAGILGWSQQELAGKSIADICAEPDKLERLIQDYRPGITACIHTCLFKKRDGTAFPVEISWGLFDLKGRQVICVIARDISLRIKMEAELIKTKKSEAAGMLAAGIAHDFNNLLSIILGNINLAQLEAQPANGIAKKLYAAEGAVLQARDLTQKFLTFARGHSPVKQTTHITATITDATRLVLCGSNVTCAFALPDELWPVDIDQGQISQVFFNLVENAKQAMDRGGTVKVSADNFTVQPEHADTQLPSRPGDYVRIRIQDSGTGIAAENLERVFDPYFTTRPGCTQKGMGFGLPIANSIIELHHGHLDIESLCGAGTTVSVYLPAAHQAPAAAPQPLFEISLTNKKILVMDDDEILRNLAQEMLELIGCQVALAADGDEALEKYCHSRQTGSPYDVVILDLNVTGGPGAIETLKKLKAVNLGIKAIVSSGYAYERTLLPFTAYGFSGILPKPFSLEQLKDVLKEALSSGNG